MASGKDEMMDYQFDRELQAEMNRLLLRVHWGTPSPQQELGKDDENADKKLHHRCERLRIAGADSGHAGRPRGE